MEYNSASSKSFITPPKNLKYKFLKIEMLKVSILKEFISKNNYLEVLNKAITERRTIINS
jgi:hypothetical protein